MADFYDFHAMTATTSSNIFVNSSISFPPTTVTGATWYSTGTGYVAQPNMPYIPAQPETPEQRRERERRERQAREDVERRNSERAEVMDRARELLLEHLNPEQADEYERRGYFHVHIETAEGRRRYRVRGFDGVLLIGSDDRPLVSYCIHPSYGFPSPDVALCQKVLLETDEAEFLRTANATPA